MPATCRDVGAVGPRPTAGGGALFHNTTTPSLHCAARVLRGRSADTPRSRTRADHAPRDANALIETFRSLCHRPIAVSWRSSPGWQREVESSPLWPRQVHTARRACSAGGRPILPRLPVVQNARRPRATGPFEVRAADRLRYWIALALVGGVRRSAPCVGPVPVPEASGARSSAPSPLLYLARGGPLGWACSLRNKRPDLSVPS